MSEPKILLQNDHIEVIEIGNRVGIQQKNPSVIILPYTTDESGNPKSLGLISEPNSLKEGGMSLTVITGSPEDYDEDILETAKRELKEEAGYEINDIEKWEYLGNIKTSKIVINGNPAFGVDVTGMERGQKSGDGSKNEENSKFSLVNLSDAINLDDALVSCLFLKIFQNKLI